MKKYVLVNRNTKRYFVNENKFGVCNDVDNIEEAMMFNSYTAAAYTECLLRDKNWYEIIEINL